MPALINALDCHASLAMTKLAFIEVPYSYRLIYRIEPARILVTAVVHGRRLLDDAMTGRIAEQ
ncbi:MAG: hypothetical protein Q8J70_03535 [Thiobacillus sp.]|nr:hypothetical protein [Thiobacillus sp.]